MSADVSVIIAAYNVEAYIERAIRSALDQQDVTVEVIVVNDASTDNTAAIVSSIGDARVKHIDLATNGGPSVARNAGIDAATAPWIAILDGDDAFLPDRLMRALTRAKAVRADIVVDNLTVHREADGAEYPMYQPAWFSRIGMLDLAAFITGNSSFLGGISLGYLKPLISTPFIRSHKLAYDPAIRIGEDYILLCDALAEGARCVVEPTAGYLYSVRKGSISHRLSLEDVKRISDGDKRFLARHMLSTTAVRAQKVRERGLKEVNAFIQLVEAIKRRDMSAALRIIAKHPSVPLHLWEAVWIRAKRLFKRNRQS